MKTNAKIKLLSILVTLVLITFYLLSFSKKNIYSVYAETLSEATNTTQNEQINNTPLPTSNEELKIYSDACILIENRTGKTLYEKNSDKKMYPASTTKILTAIIVLEKGNLQDKTTVSRSAIVDMKSSYTSADLVEGEILTVQELLEVLLVRSANDASNVLAEYISGSIPEFVNLMNKKLQEIGCMNTHFVTTNGLHDDNHYTTAKDMAIITRYCMRNATFRKIVAMQKCIIPATNKSEKRIYKNTNDLIINTSIYFYPGCIGVKTGFTSQAKNCLISACNKNNLQTIAVVLGASLTENNKSARYVDSKTLYDYAYKNYSFLKIASANSIVKTIEVKGATQETKNLNLLLQNDINALVKKETSQNIIPEITLNDNISAPISKNSILGQITYIIDGEQYTTNLIAEHNVEKEETILIKDSDFLKNDSMHIIFKISFLIISLIIILILIYILLKKCKKN